MAKKVLRIEYDFDFTLIGISASVKEYRLCWYLNKELGFEFIRMDDLEMRTDNSEDAYFSLYKHAVENSETDFFYLSNKGNSNYLIPESKETDYFLMANYRLNNAEERNLLSDMNKIEVIHAAYLINPETLKSKENFLIF